MKTFIYLILTVVFCISSTDATSQVKNARSVTVPVSLDHNRMLVDAEMQRSDGTWRKVRLWVDSGYPIFCISEALARDLGIDLSPADDSSFRRAQLPVPTPSGLRIGNLTLNTDSVPTAVTFLPFWFFSTMNIDGNLPSSILRKYRIVFDYPKRKMTIAEPGSTTPQGTGVPVTIHPETGIARVNAIIDNDSLGFALDVGASYCLISEEDLLKFSSRHPDWPIVTGTLGHANLWGWWPPNEQQFPVVRVSEIKLDNGIVLKSVGMTGITKFSNGLSWGEWYSQKTARPVNGLLGPNALRAYRVEIDYDQNMAYFKKEAEPDSTEMDIVGISVRQLADGTFQVVGIVQCDGKSSVEGISPEDIIISIDGTSVKGKTMGTVVDMLRGIAGEKRLIRIIRNGKEYKIDCEVKHYL